MDLQPSTKPPNHLKASMIIIFPLSKHHGNALPFLLILLTLPILYLLRPSLYSRSPLWTSYSRTPVHRGGCDYSDGKWAFDPGYPGKMYDENCPFLDEGFRCRGNGRMDDGFRKWRWQPHGCDLPRFNASDLLKRSCNGRIIFAGDSIARNQWESMLCMLAQGVLNRSTIYEENGSPITKHKGFLSMRFEEYNLTVEYYRAPFLVRVTRPPPNSPAKVRGAIRVDKLHRFSNKWIGADVLIFSGGHWWTEDKTIKTGAYFQEGQAINMKMDCNEAFSRASRTWKSWAMQNLDPLRAHIFFRGHSPVHYRNRTWDQGGTCKDNTAPEIDSANFQAESVSNQFISRITKEMEAENRNVKYLNITYLTEFRSDGHPSIHREQGTAVPVIEDCSHWCLPGVPDTWNEILYAHLLLEGFRTKSK